ncbi:uncharacterized protein [Macrobrachium rosenbergii]|uniref:uncharacterized protein isoform X1 n=1 Tax=Macrobrachium rosenbergii TaxID=79674 RepID=UPI0034D71FF1
MARYRKVPENYFKFVNPIIVSLIGVGMYLLLMAWLDPRNISTTYFGRVAEFATWLGTENNHLMKQILLCLLAIHIIQALIGVYLCQKHRLGSLVTIAWTLQNLILGFPSLYYLIWPQKPRRSSNSGKKEESNKNSNKSKEGKNANKGKETKNSKSKEKNHAKSRKDK